MTEDRPRPGKQKVKPLKIYRTVITEESGNIMSTAIVVAKTAKRAKEIHGYKPYYSIDSEYMGVAKKGRREGLILVSKN